MVYSVVQYNITRYNALQHSCKEYIKIFLCFEYPSSQQPPYGMVVFYKVILANFSRMSSVGPKHIIVPKDTMRN